MKVVGAQDQWQDCAPRQQRQHLKEKPPLPSPRRPIPKARRGFLRSRSEAGQANANGCDASTSRSNGDAQAHVAGSGRGRQLVVCIPVHIGPQGEGVGSHLRQIEDAGRLHIDGLAGVSGAGRNTDDLAGDDNATRGDGSRGGNGVGLPGFCGERLAHFLGLSLEGDWALEAER